MEKTEKAKIVNYQDELNDEFSGIAPKHFFIPKDYCYIHKNIVYRFFAFLGYRLVLTPLAFFHSVFSLHQSFPNRAILKPYRKSGYFIYGNHTQQLGGGYTPSLLCFPKKVYLVCSADNLAVQGLKTLFEMGGALPLPSTLEGMKNFMEALEKRNVQGHVICIYPEAHIWPYCTWIRPFGPTSFRYAVKLSSPVFAFTDCYKKRRHGKKPRIVTFADGPFFPDESLSAKEAAQKLRDQVYEAMVARAKKESDYVLIEYVKKEGTKT